jgi:hypothetical protein
MRTLSQKTRWQLSYALWSPQVSLNQYRYALLFWVDSLRKTPNSKLPADSSDTRPTKEEGNNRHMSVR